jgi:acyl-homoserine lactone acylase PvdQ
MMTVILVPALPLVVVGINVQLIWPLTDWDLATVTPV